MGFQFYREIQDMHDAIRSVATPTGRRIRRCPATKYQNAYRTYACTSIHVSIWLLIA